MRRIDLVSCALLVGAAGLVGYLAVQGKLGWARQALAVYADGGTTSTWEHTLEMQATALLQRGDAAEARKLLEESLAIDPNSSAVHKLGDAYLAEGDVDAARRQYEAYLELDPAYVPSYLQLLEIYDRLGLPDERAALLDRGIAYFEANLEAFRPRPDDDVHEAYNDKAYGVYNAYREGLELLRHERDGASPEEADAGE